MSKTIVIVEDEAHIRFLLEQALEELGDEMDLRLLFAADGQQGLELIRTAKPHVVLLDVMLPRMNGFEVCQQIKSDSDLEGTEVIMLSAKVGEEDRLKGLLSGACRYVAKPFDPDKLAQMVRQLLV